MKKGKILTAIAGAAVLATTPFLFTACGNNNDKKDDKKDDAIVEIKPEKDAKISGYSIKISVDEANAIIDAFNEDVENGSNKMAKITNTASLTKEHLDLICQTLAGNFMDMANYRPKDFIAKSNSGDVIKYIGGEMYMKVGDNETWVMESAQVTTQENHEDELQQSQTSSVPNIYRKTVDDKGKVSYTVISAANFSTEDESNMYAAIPSQYYRIFMGMMMNNGQLDIYDLEHSTVANGNIVMKFNAKTMAQITDASGLEIVVKNGVIASENVSTPWEVKIDDKTETYYMNTVNTYTYADKIDATKDKITLPTKDKDNKTIEWTDLNPAEEDEGDGE